MLYSLCPSIKKRNKIYPKPYSIYYIYSKREFEMDKYIEKRRRSQVCSIFSLCLHSFGKLDFNVLLSFMPSVEMNMSYYEIQTIPSSTRHSTIANRKCYSCIQPNTPMSYRDEYVLFLCELNTEFERYRFVWPLSRITISILLLEMTRICWFDLHHQQPF